MRLIDSTQLILSAKNSDFVTMKEIVDAPSIIIDGEFEETEKSYMNKVAIYPTEHHYEDVGEPEYVKYGCPICELLGARHSFPKSTQSCPICGVNLVWKHHNTKV